MLTSLANVSLIIRDYDEAIQWFTEVLGLELHMDGSMGDGYRFVTVVAPYQETPPQISVRLLGKPKPGANSFEIEISENGKMRREILDWK